MNFQTIGSRAAFGVALALLAGTSRLDAQAPAIEQARRDARMVLDNAQRANDEMQNHARDLLRLVDHRPWRYTQPDGNERTYHGAFAGVFERDGEPHLRWTTSRSVPLAWLGEEDLYLIDTIHRLMDLVAEHRKNIEDPAFLGGFDATEVALVRVRLPTVVTVRREGRRVPIPLRAGQILQVTGESERALRIQLDDGTAAEIAHAAVEPVEAAQIEQLPAGDGPPAVAGPGAGPLAIEVPPPMAGRPGIDFPRIDAQISFDNLGLTHPRFDVVPFGGAAWQTGIRPGDWLISVNGFEVGDDAEYRQAATAGGGRLRLVVANGISGRTFVAEFGSLRAE